MTCPAAREWELLALEALDSERVETLLAHARACPACRTEFEAARRAHIDRVRMYEAFDRDHDELREQLLATLPAQPPRSSAADRLVRGWYRLGDVVMTINKTAGRRAAAVLVPAACILIAVLVLLVPGSERSAFAAALERLRTARTIVCRVSTPDGVEFQGLKVQTEGRMYLSDEYGSRTEMSANGFEVTRTYAPLQGPIIVVQPAARTWMELDTSQLTTLDMSAQTPDAFVRALVKLTDDSASELGTETIDGHAALGYRVAGEKLGFAPSNDPNVASTHAEVWVDVATRLPARFVMDAPMPGQSPGARLRMVYDEFEWDTPLAASVFEPDIPTDYTKVDVKFARPTEETLVHALARMSDLTGGRYTSTLDMIGWISELHTLIPAENFQKFDTLGQAGIAQFGMEVGAGVMYYMQLVREGREPEYFGADVTAADADQVLVRWKLEDGRYRVIYGDLHVETLPAK